MALFIAKSPQYRSNQTVPRQIGGRYADLRPSTAENQAIGRIGNLLRQRAEEMKQERDTAVVGDLYNHVSRPSKPSVQATPLSKELQAL